MKSLNEFIREAKEEVKDSLVIDREEFDNLVEVPAEADPEEVEELEADKAEKSENK